MKTFLILGPSLHNGTMGGVTQPYADFCDFARNTHLLSEYNVRALQLRLEDLPNLAWQLLTLRGDSIILFHATWRATVLLAPLLGVLTAVTQCRVYLRKFAGDFDQRFSRQPFLVRQLLTRALNRFHAVFFETKYLVDWGTRRRWRCFWWPNSRRAPDFDIESLGDAREGTHNRLLFLGRVCVAKGAMQLHRFLREGCSIDVWGPLEPREAKIISDYVAQFSGRITLRGALERQHLYSTLACYDALLLPTSWPSEGYPGVIIEAAMVGVPSIVPLVRGPRELVEMLGTGTITEELPSPYVHETLGYFERARLAQRAQELFLSDRVFQNILHQMLHPDPIAEPGSARDK